MSGFITGYGTHQVHHEQIIEWFTTHWFPFMGKPIRMHADMAGGHQGVEEWCHSLGIDTQPTASGAHWQAGSIEVEVKAMEVAMSKIYQYLNPASQASAKQIFGIQLALANDTPGLDGFSPFQRYSGRTPNVPVLSAPSDLPSTFEEWAFGGPAHRNAELRRAVRIAWEHGIITARVKRAEKARTRQIT